MTSIEAFFLFSAILAGVCYFASHIWIIVLAFQEGSVTQGILGILFFGIMFWFVVIAYWSESKRPFALAILSLILGASTAVAWGKYSWDSVAQPNRGWTYLKSNSR